MPRYNPNDETQKFEENTKQVQPAEEKKTQAPEDPYAHMFADWDLVPPQMVIRRVRRNG